VAILARSGDALEETRDLIVADVPGADVLVLAADVCDVEAVRGAVQSVLRRFGKLDILIANAGAVTAFTPSENLPFLSSVAEGLTVHSIKVLNKEDPNAWWNTFEVNIRGSFNFIRYVLFPCG